MRRQFRAVQKVLALRPGRWGLNTNFGPWLGWPQASPLTLLNPIFSFEK